MRLASVFLCEYAATTREGKLDAGGILNLVWGTEFPLHITQLVFIALLELEEEEYGFHTFRVVLENIATKASDVLLEGHFSATGRFHRNGIDLNGITFPEPGLYCFRILVNGRDLGHHNLVVSDEEPVYPGGAETPDE